MSGSAPVHAQAVTDARVLTTQPSVLLALAEQDPRVGLWMASESAARVDGLLQELAMNAFWPVLRRLARHLLDLAANEQQGRVLLVRASQQELADAVGTVREVVARTLGTLRSDGYIETGPSGIRLLDPAALADLST